MSGSPREMCCHGYRYVLLSRNSKNAPVPPTHSIMNYLERTLIISAFISESFSFSKTFSYSCRHDVVGLTLKDSLSQIMMIQNIFPQTHRSQQTNSSRHTNLSLQLLSLFDGTGSQMFFPAKKDYLLSHY